MKEIGQSVANDDDANDDNKDFSLIIRMIKMIVVMRKIIKTNDLDDIEYSYIFGELCDKKQTKVIMRIN